MNRLMGVTMAFIVASILSLSFIGEAAAARMGGGKSFGSRPSYSAPYQRSPSSTPAMPQQQPAYKNPQQASNQGLRDSFARRGGLMGMLGGLALGGLLGAMFLGGGFEHIGLMDVLVFGLIAYLLYRLFAARNRVVAPVTSVPGGQGYPDPTQAMRRDAAAFDTDILRAPGVSGAGTSVQQARQVPYPADFDAEAFSYGATAAYRQLQQAWDHADLSGLRALTTDKVFAELQDQLKQREGMSQTDVISINLSILSVVDEGSQREASVLFDVMLREEAGADPKAVQEVWHFVRPLSSRQPTWFLDGIQQVDNNG